MNALEFSGKIEGGIIRLPQGYEEYDNTYARVIVLVQEPAQPAAQKDKLRQIFQKMESTTMFSGIDDPVKWQKQARNEWE